MRKASKIFFLSIFISILFLSTFSMAQEGVKVSNPLNVSTIEGLIEKIANFLVWVVIAISPLVALIGAFFILISGGNPEQVEKGKKAILYAVIALLIVLLARGLIGLAKMVLTGG